MNPYQIANEYTNYKYIDVYFSDHISSRLCRCPLSDDYIIVCEKTNYKQDEYKIIQAKYLFNYLASYELITLITAPEEITEGVSDSTVFLYQF